MDHKNEAQDNVEALVHFHIMKNLNFEGLALTNWFKKYLKFRL